MNGRPPSKALGGINNIKLIQLNWEKDMKRRLVVAVILLLVSTLFSGTTWAALSQTEVSQLYVSIFGRASEGEGNAYWRSNQDDMVNTANTMLATEAAQSYFGSTLYNNQLFIEFIYENTLGKTYAEDPVGVNYWVAELSSGKSKGQVVATLINSVMDPQYTGLPAQDRFINKVEVCSYTAEIIATCPDVNDLSAFVGFISSVTHDSATVEIAKAAIRNWSGLSIQAATFIAGNNIAVNTETIDDTGGTITITGTGTYLDNIQIVFPPGALLGSTQVTAGYNDGTLSLPEGVTSSQVAKTLTIHASEGSDFSQLVEITVPYTDEQNLPVPFYVDNNNQLRTVLVTNIDKINKTFTFVTAHASLWTWLVDVFTDSPDEDSGFRPTDDGFQIANYGSTINSGGECFGMTTFAQWYYDEKMASNGGFYDKYMTTVGTDSSGNGLTGQDVIATRAFSAANQSWNFSEFILPNINTDDEYRYNAIVSALKMTKRPVNLSIKQVDQSGNFIAGHAVLAFGVDENDGQLFIYDPNHPAESHEIIYDSTAKKFQPYGSYSKFFLNGIGTYSLDESYLNIFEDAEHDFTRDNMPHISITSHQNGETVYSRNIELTGLVESSEVLITQIDVFVNNEKFSADVAEDGSFTVGISLNIGEQAFRFITKNEAGDAVNPNNMDANPFTISVALDTSVMLVTLTWDKSDTDLDLYVIDPQGDYSAYYNMLTADGGELDYDVVTGYGPEHWTLSSNDIIRWGQNAYRVRVHYYDDNYNGGTNYKLSVKLYEGTTREVEYIKTGYLSANDSSNDGPEDTGADWVDFTFPITLTSTDSQSAFLPTSHAIQGDALPISLMDTTDVSVPSKIRTDVPPADIRRGFKNK
jgi:uncharacterized protein YfaP (DUF2135 family)